MRPERRAKGTMERKRKGMIIKNTGPTPMSIAFENRTVDIPPKGTIPIMSEEAMNDALRDLLQVRALAIVRPLTPSEEAAIRESVGQVEKPAAV